MARSIEEERRAWERLVEEVVADVADRVAAVYNYTACPRCDAPVGERCRRMIGGVGYRGKHNKHPHRERLHAAGIYER